MTAVAYDVLCRGQKHKKRTCAEFKKGIQALAKNTSSLRRLSYPNMLRSLYVVKQNSAATGLVLRRNMICPLNTVFM
jgi:hypothetical protein